MYCFVFPRSSFFTQICLPLLISKTQRCPHVFFLTWFDFYAAFLFPSVFCLLCRPLLFSTALLSLVNTITQAVRCCRHFVADHGAENLLPSNCQSVHFMVHILCSPFVRVPLVPTLISLTPSHTNNNKSKAHLFYLSVTALLLLLGFQLRRGMCQVLFELGAEHLVWSVRVCFCSLILCCCVAFRGLIMLNFVPACLRFVSN